MKLEIKPLQRLKIFLYALVGIVSSLFLYQDGKITRETSPFERVTIDATSYLQEKVADAKRFSASLVDHYIFNINASRENIVLKKDVKSLKNHIFQIKEVELENERLKNLLRFGEKNSYKKILGQIVFWDYSSRYKMIRINKGSKHGVKLQSSVVTSDGLVGYIFRLTKHYSDILTVLAASNRIDGLVQRTRSHGIVEGYEDNKCRIKYIMRTEPIILNDVIITSGIGNLYPKGLKIGRVVRIERKSYGITQNVFIEPYVDFSSLEEVVVLIPQNEASKTKEWKALNDVTDKRHLR